MDPRYLDYCTCEDQRAAVEAVIAYGSNRKAAKALGKAPSSVDQMIQRIKKRAAKQGFAPDSRLEYPVPPGMEISKISDMVVNELGKPVWVQLKPETEADEKLACILAAIEGRCESLPSFEPIATPTECNQDLLNLYTFSDYHMGMLAWHREGGADWDLEIAKKMLVGALEQMLAQAPNSKYAIVNNLGDFLHYDGLIAETPTSKHPLDSDSRFRKIFDASVECLEMLVFRALEKHEQVHVLMAEGNHDIVTGGVVLGAMMRRLFRDNPRVTVDSSALPYYAYQHGTTMLGFHHGHMTKKPGLPELFAQEFREMFGRTTRTYIHTGHLHHMDIKERSTAYVIQHPTLAARDAHASRGGWHSDRRAICFTYHKQHGQWSSNEVTPAMIDPSLADRRRGVEFASS